MYTTFSISASDVSTSDVLHGIRLILKYQIAATFSADHDIIYFGAYKPEQMTEAELEQMDEWGWREEYDSWAKHI